MIDRQHGIIPLPTHLFTECNVWVKFRPVFDRKMNVYTAIVLPLTLSLTYRTCKIQEEEAKSLLLLRLSLIPRLLDPFPGFSTPTCSLLDPFPGFLTPSCWLLDPFLLAS